MRHLLPSFYLILFCSACLAQPIVFTEGQQSVSVVEHSSVLVESPGQTVTIDSLLKNPNRYRFVPVEKYTHADGNEPVIIEAYRFVPFKKPTSDENSN
jgi:ribosomal protein S27E